MPLTEWLKLMLAEIARKREEAERTRDEELARQRETQQREHEQARREQRRA